MSRAMPIDRVVSPASGDVDRRSFLSGGWTSGMSEIASALVQARPERLADVAQAIGRIDGVEVFGSDPRGKLVVVIEARDSGAIGATLNSIALLPNVLSAALVFHAIDAG
jgi:periplasmic nitrate reductase NapD